MERESFENAQIAEILNEHFVPIKVDREERPDVDRVYMNFVQVIEIITFVNCLRLFANVGSPNNNKLSLVGMQLPYQRKLITFGQSFNK